VREEDRPPLANQLFDDRPIFVQVMQQFRECMEVVPLLRKAGISVESELAKLQRQAETFPRVHQELAAIRYYLHVALWICQDHWRAQHLGITNYATLLREIERWRYSSSGSVCFVTFNYDTMLEEAMSQVLGLQIRDLSGYLHRAYTLIKLHGSINWGREVDGQPSIEAPHTYNPQRLITEAATLRLSNRYRLVSNRPMNREGEAQRLVFPALSIPVERKDEFNCPEAHVDRLRELLPAVSKLVTVGWRATEADFLQILRENLQNVPPAMVVSGTSDGVRETGKNLAAAGLTVTDPLDCGFSGLILENLEKLERFLRQVVT